MSTFLHNLGKNLLLNSYNSRYYATLGAVLDFHDDLLIYAYDQQVATDYKHVKYYLECLQSLQAGRGSETLQIKVDIEAANDRISFQDVKKAYRDLDIDPRAKIDDDTIIGVFNSRVVDATKQEDEMRRALRILGVDRSSQKIQIIASQGTQSKCQFMSFHSQHPSNYQLRTGTVFFGG